MDAKGRKRIILARSVFRRQSSEDELKSLLEAIVNGKEHVPSRRISLSLDSSLMKGDPRVFTPEIRNRAEQWLAKWPSSVAELAEEANALWPSGKDNDQRQMRATQLAIEEILKLLSESGVESAAAFIVERQRQKQTRCVRRPREF